jgi:hypothetical protein
LQQVSDVVVRPAVRRRVTVDLSANALQLVVLEPTNTKSK